MHTRRQLGSRRHPVRPYLATIGAITLLTALAASVGGLVAFRDGARPSAEAKALADASLLALTIPSIDDPQAESQLRLVLQRLIRARDGVVGAACWLRGEDSAHDLFVAAGDPGDTVALREHARLDQVRALPDGRTVAAPVRAPGGESLGVVLLRTPAPLDAPLPWWPLGAFVATALTLAFAHFRIGRPVQRLETLAPSSSRPGSLRKLADQLVDDLNEARITARLERHVRVRTRELEQLARRADDHLANTAHELRTPLTAILAAVDMLRDGYATTEEERRQFLDQAAISGQHLMLLLNDLLDRAAVEAGRLRIEARDCFAADLLGDAERILEPAATARGAKLSVEIGADADRAVRADPTRVLQVLFNLVGNALKYSPGGSPVTLRATAAERGVVVEVEDRGIGVPKAQRGLLFQRFSRVHDEGSSSASGTGIGLWVCKALIESMGGEIGHREAADGCGSVFWFRLLWAPDRSPSGRRAAQGKGSAEPNEAQTVPTA